MAASAAALSMVGVVALWPFGTVTSVSAAQSSVGLGTAGSFAVLAGTTVTNTGPSLISGDLGVSPGTAVTNFPPGLVVNGSQHDGDAVAAQAQADLTTAYNDAAGRTPATLLASNDLGGLTLAPGVYKAPSSLFLTGTVTLDGQNTAGAVFIFQVASTLITASNSTVALIRGVDPCNVFWQVGSSATLGTNTTFVGSILALTDATIQTQSTVAGRVLARNGQVSLDDNSIIAPNCPTTTTTTTATTATTSTPPTPNSTTATSTTVHTSTSIPTTATSTTMHTSTSTPTTATSTAASTTQSTSAGTFRTTTPTSSATTSAAAAGTTGTSNGTGTGVSGASAGTPNTGAAVPIGLGLFLILGGTAGVIRGRRRH